MKVAYISTSLPNECGIATFNANLFAAVGKNKMVNSESFIVALDNKEHSETYKYPEEVKYIIEKNTHEDYLSAASYLNTSGAEVCILEHEFGIFGGEGGMYILSLLAGLTMPVVTIFHTVLKQPSYIEQTIIREVAKYSSKIVVMSHKAIGFLTGIYHVPQQKIKLIEHGVPDLEPELSNPVKAMSPFCDKKVLLTFGLISPNKGLETVIRALPAILEQHPNVVYVVLGNTHPGVVKHAGETYRDQLKALAQKLKVDQHLIFVNKFVSETELHAYLTAADLYITPYLSEAQITSGTLAYAIGAGAAVISTPYWHALELLTQNRGKLFDFKDNDKLASIVNHLLSNPEALQRLKKNAFQYGLKLRWPAIGKAYAAVLDEAKREVKQLNQLEKTIIDPDIMPAFSLAHIYRLTDRTGIIQHAKYSIPNLKEGYCMDDNARALLVCLSAFKYNKSYAALELLPVYLSFIHYMQRDDGNFRNFLSFSRQYLDEEGSDDSFGRTLWALGFLVCQAPNNSYKEFAEELFAKSVPHFKKLTFIRGIANTLIGIAYYLQAFPSDMKMRSEMDRLANVLVSDYQQNREANWHWYENQLTYDNAILPLALLSYYEISGDRQAFSIAMESLEFLKSLTFSDGYFNPVGNAGWCSKGEKPAKYDQQAIETMAMVLACFKAYEMTGELQHMRQMYRCYEWFLGKNSLSLPLYDYETKGCADGLETDGVNRNQGAESTLAYLMSHLVVFKALEFEYQDAPNPADIKEKIMEN